MNIWVSGKKRSGKDTFFQITKEFISTRYPEIIVHRYSFANKVKLYAEKYFKVDPWSEEEEKEKIRFILQGIGQMFRVEVDKEYWIKALIADIQPDTMGIITDVRYKNEAAIVSSLPDSLLVRIKRPSLPVEDFHPSEIELDDYKFDHYILNNGNLEDYREQVIMWLNTNLLLPSR